jgi:hypothetical protein
VAQLCATRVNRFWLKKWLKSAIAGGDGGIPSGGFPFINQRIEFSPIAHTQGHTQTISGIAPDFELRGTFLERPSADKPATLVAVCP